VTRILVTKLPGRGWIPRLNRRLNEASLRSANWDSFLRALHYCQRLAMPFTSIVCTSLSDFNKRNLFLKSDVLLRSVEIHNPYALYLINYVHRNFSYKLIIFLFHFSTTTNIFIFHFPCVGFVMCGCFGNMCTCIYSVLYCLYCVFCIVLFMYIYSYLFCLY